VSKRESKSRPAAGIVEFHHKAFKQDGTLVAECHRQAFMRMRQKEKRPGDWPGLKSFWWGSSCVSDAAAVVAAPAVNVPLDVLLVTGGSNPTSPRQFLRQNRAPERYFG
jgi:hypothetical protein